ncbi:MAG: hypothetical protein KDK39_01275 [Leptospiraceae bacterium]|nr:hypothetical protein [Leptospiraceae bacterium]
MALIRIQENKKTLMIRISNQILFQGFVAMGWRQFASITLVVIGAVMRAVALMLDQQSFEIRADEGGSITVLQLLLFGLVPYGMAFLWLIWVFWMQNDGPLRSAAFFSIFYLVFLPLIVKVLSWIFGWEHSFSVPDLRLFWLVFPGLQILTTGLVFWFLFRQSRS